MEQPVPVRMLRRGLATLAVAMLTLMVPISAASAHDALTGSNPEDGQSLETMPEEIELTFTNAPTALGSEIIIEDAEGTDWSTGEIEIVDTVVTQAINPDAPSGEYTVTWRVVSSDSHPIEGVFEYTATSGGAGTNASSQQQPQETAPAEAQKPQTEVAAETFPTSSVVVMIAVLTALIIIIAVLARTRLGKNAGRD